MRALRSAVLVAIFLVALGAHGQQVPPAKSSTETVSEWMRGNRVLIGVTQERLGFSALWRFERSDTGDILLDQEENRGNQTSRGSVILIGKGALLLRDVRAERGRELDALNGPLLMLQLVMRLLERAVPEGPKSLAGGDRKIAINESSKGIKVVGVGADGEFFAPWSLTGTIGPAPDGQVKFEFEFVSASRTTGTSRYQSSISGIWQNVPRAMGLPDSFALRGWRVHQIKDVVKPLGSSNAVGPGTTAPMLFANVGEVRRSVTQWANEAERRARFQCN